MIIDWYFFLVSHKILRLEFYLKYSPFLDDLVMYNDFKMIILLEYDSDAKYRIS